MADFQSVKSHFDFNNLTYYSFYHKSENLVKAALRHLPHNTPAEDISGGLVSLGFDVISVKQVRQFGPQMLKACLWTKC
jgi:hypothetical protein